MKTAILVLAALAAFAAAEEFYTTKYDSLDIDAILGNKRLFDSHVACLLKKGKCTEEGAVLRDVIPDALITGCAKCNKYQKETVEKVTSHIISNCAPCWRDLLKTYDADGKYQDKYQHYLAKIH